MTLAINSSQQGFSLITSLTLGQFPNISKKAIKLPDISRFSRQVAKLNKRPKGSFNFICDTAIL